MAPPLQAPQVVLRQAARVMAVAMQMAGAVAQLVALIRMPTCIRKLDPYGKLCHVPGNITFRLGVNDVLVTVISPK